MTKLKSIISMLIIAVLVFMLSSCRQADTETLVSNAFPNAYGTHLVSPDTLSSAFYHCKSATLTRLQAEAYLAAGVKGQYREDFLATVVLCVDSQRTRADIVGWSSLRYSDIKVFIELDDRYTAYYINAIAAGLDRGGGIAEALNFLEYLHNDGRLTSAEEADVQIMFDYQAAELKKQNSAVKIVVPVEGSCSYSFGMFFKEGAELLESPRAELLSAGARLPDGECDSFLYPEASAYDKVKREGDFAQFYKRIRNIDIKIEREVLGTNILRMREGVILPIYLIAVTALLIFWSASVYMRSYDREIRRHLLVISILIALWMFLRILRGIGLPMDIRVFLWYCYYISMCIIPCLFLDLALYIKQDGKRLKGLMRAVYSIAVVFIIIVLTNNFHMLVFDNVYEHNYGYNFMYYVIFAWNAMLSLSAFILLIAANKGQHGRLSSSLVVACIASCMLIYAVCFTLRVQAVFFNETSIFACLMICATLEACLQSGLIISNKKHYQLFETTDLQMCLLSLDYKVIYSTVNRPRLPDGLLERIKGFDFSDGEMLKFTDYSAEMLYRVYGLSAGYAVVSDSVSQVLRLSRQLEEKSIMLKGQIADLALKQEQLQEFYEIEYRAQLLDEVRHSIKNKTSMIKDILNTMPKQFSSSLDRESIEKLKRIKLLVGYCKRKANLSLLAKSGEVLSAEGLRLLFSEMLTDAEGLLVQGAVSVKGGMGFGADVVSVIYDLVESCIESLIIAGGGDIMMAFNLQEEKPSVRVMLFADTKGEFSGLDSQLLSAIGKCSGEVTVAQEEERVLICCTFERRSVNA